MVLSLEEGILTSKSSLISSRGHIKLGHFLSLTVIVSYSDSEIPIPHTSVLFSLFSIFSCHLTQGYTNNVFKLLL